MVIEGCPNGQKHCLCLLYSQISGFFVKKIKLWYGVWGGVSHIFGEFWWKLIDMSELKFSGSNVINKNCWDFFHITIIWNKAPKEKILRKIFLLNIKEVYDFFQQSPLILFSYDHPHFNHWCCLCLSSNCQWIILYWLSWGIDDFRWYKSINLHECQTYSYLPVINKLYIWHVVTLIFVWQLKMYIQYMYIYVHNNTKYKK